MEISPEIDQSIQEPGEGNRRAVRVAALSQLSFPVHLSDHVAHFGLEHHESSDDRDRRAHADRSRGRRSANADLLPHEFAHSWNGKYRRPARPGLRRPRWRLRHSHEGRPALGVRRADRVSGRDSAPRSGLWTPEDIASSWPRPRRRWITSPAAPGGRWKTPPSPRRFSTTPRAITPTTAAAWIIIPKAR